MLNKPTGFHVRHDFKPEYTYELLLLLHALAPGQDQASLRAEAEKRGYLLRQRKDYAKFMRSLIELEMLDGAQGRYKLTQQGHIVAEASVFQPHLLAELVHFRYYTGFDDDENKRFSWSYRIVCDWLWDYAPCEVNRDRLVNVVTQKAAEVFEIQGVSFSVQSVAGVLNWLEALNPPCVMPDGVFSRRSYCSVESFMCALAHVYEHCEREGLSAVVTPDFKERVCRICLMTLDAFDELLALAETNFDCLDVWRKRGERIVINSFHLSRIVE